MKNRLYSLLLCGLLLLSLCACGQAVEVPEPQEPVAESAAPPITTIPRDYEGEWRALVQEYHTGEWLWSEATACSHGNPVDYCDGHAVRILEDGTVEELIFCNYRMRIYASDEN